ncbi:MAG: hypothetical protein OHK0017_05870 [Patescibacteria group bacterium]
MNILYVSSPISSSYAGGERFVDNLTSHFPKEKHIFLGSSQALFDLFKKKGYEAHKMNLPLYEPVTKKNLLLSPISFISGLVYLFKYRQIINQADLIVTPTSFCEIFFVLPWLSIFTKKKILIISQNDARAVFINPLKFIVKFMIQRHSNVLVSETSKKTWAKYGLVSDKTVIIPHGVPISDLNPVDGSISPEKLTFGFLARMHKEKGVETLLKALPLLKNTTTPIEFVLGGDGPHLQEFKNLADSLDIPKNVKLTWKGFVSDTKSFYDQLDLFVFPSRKETFGLVVVESWERGVPALCSDLEILYEIKNQASELEQKLMFKLDDSGDLALAMDRFISSSDKFLNRQNRQKLHDLVKSRFSLSNLDKYQSFWK